MSLHLFRGEVTPVSGRFHSTKSDVSNEEIWGREQTYLLEIHPRQLEPLKKNGKKSDIYTKIWPCLVSMLNFWDVIFEEFPSSTL